jgi:hypothetical protein
MSGPLRVAKAGVEEAIGRLQPNDRFSVVVRRRRDGLCLHPASAEGAAARFRLAARRRGAWRTNLAEGARLRAGRSAPGGRRVTAACS